MMIGRPVWARNTGESPIEASTTAFAGIFSSSHFTIGRYSSGDACSRFRGAKLSIANCHMAATKTTDFPQVRSATRPAPTTATANPKNVKHRNAIHASGTSNNVNTMKIFVAQAPRLPLVNKYPSDPNANGPHHSKLRQNSPHGAVSKAPPSHNTRASHGSSAGLIGLTPSRRSLYTKSSYTCAYS